MGKIKKQKQGGLTSSKAVTKSSLVGASGSSIPSSLLRSTSLGSSIITVNLTYIFSNTKINWVSSTRMGNLVVGIPKQKKAPKFTTTLKCKELITWWEGNKIYNNRRTSVIEVESWV